MWRLILVALAVVSVPRPAMACVVGDTTSTPTIEITSCPEDCCYGSFAGWIDGTVNNVDTATTVVVIYVQTDWFYVQPFADSRKYTEIQCDGGFTNWTRGGHHYVAILAKRTWDTPSQLFYLPAVDGETILAITLDFRGGTPACPRLPKAIHWKGYDWMIKSGGETIAVGPGPNNFSDSPDHVWIDEQDRLHLRIDSTGGRWYCAEILTQRYMGYGRYTFCVDSPVNSLDSSGVFAGFVYESVQSELDIEFSMGLACPTNASYVVQPYTTPGNLYCYDLALECSTSCYELIWTPGRAVFLTRSLDCGQTIERWWEYTGPDVPVPDKERWHLNLWLVGGSPPSSAQEVIISDFRFDDGPTGITTVPEFTSDLSQNYPNPFNPSTTIRYTVKARSQVALRIYNVSGKLVRTLVEDMRDPNPEGHTVTWDGADDAGQPVSSGVYFCSLTTNGVTQARKIVLIK